MSAGLADRLHAWRGRSGRRYVVSVYAPSAPPDYAEAVWIAVGRAPDGTRAIRAVFAVEPGATAAGDLRLAGADEAHVHLLACDADERKAVVEDLASVAS